MAVLPPERQTAPAGRYLASLKQPEPTAESTSAISDRESAILLKKQAGMSGVSQPPYLAYTLDVQRIQAALRAAERGDTYLLFTIFRDMTVSYSHLICEWGKRKGVIVGQPFSILPYDKENEDDKIACEVIKEAIDNCRNWEDGLDHLLDATLYPLSVAEKIWEPVQLADSARFKYLKRYSLKEISPVDYTVLCFKVPYQPGFLTSQSQTAQQFSADDWNAWLRFYKIGPRGEVMRTINDIYQPDMSQHIVYRGNFLSPTIPPNFGGQMRAVLFWYLLATKDRDWWGLMMSKYGMPIPVAKADTQQKDTVQFLQQALALGTQLGAIVIDKRAELEFEQVNMTDGSNSHKIFSDFANCEVSKLVVGQVLSSTPKNTGLGSGMADQAEGVRNEIRISDQTKLRQCLRKQLFKQILELNGYKGRPPLIYWGGTREADSQLFTKSLAQLRQGGYRLTQKGLTTAQEKLGYEVEYDPQPATAKPAMASKDEDE